MKYLFIPFLFITLKAHAQSFIQDIQAVNEQVGQNEVDDYLKNPSKDGLPGPILQTLIPKPGIDPETSCEDDGESKKTHYEVVLVAEANSKEAELEILPGQRAQLHTNDLQKLMNWVSAKDNSRGLSSDAVTQRATDVWNSGLFTTPGKDFDPKTPMGRELVIESIVHASANSSLNEKDLSRSIATTISNIYSSEAEKLHALSALSLRLYRNYNNARNPGFDNPKNNPYDAELPAGDMTINQMMNAASRFDVFQGGVCNDISEAVAMVGEHLFPDKDVLTVNAGSHFGVVVADGETNYVIDGGDEMRMSNRLMLDPKLAPTNLRISQVKNGALREIAVMDTEMGQVTEAAFQTGKKLLNSDADVSTVMAHLKKNNFGVSMGAASLTDSNVVIVVAKYETAGDKWKTYIGAGASAQKFMTDGLDSKYQVHFRAGAERNMFSYVNSKTEINFATGARLGGMYTLNQPQNTLGGVSRLDMSGSLDLYNRLDMNFGQNNPNGVQVRSSLEVEHTLGPTNWGNTTGALSYMSPRDTGTILKNVTFHLNQINAEVSAEKRLSSNVTGFANTSYQGSNVGQRAGILAGLDIKAPSGAQIIVFTGYQNSNFRGYKTQHSLLAGETGPHIGAKYVTPRGIEFGAAARNISGKPSFNATIKVPLGKKKK